MKGIPEDDDAGYGDLELVSLSNVYLDAGGFLLYELIWAAPDFVPCALLTST